DSNIYIVSEANAFAWPEVYFPGLGWVEFNPTPSEPRVSRTGTDDTTFSDSGGEEVFDDSALPPDTGPTTDSAATTVDNLQIEESNHIVSRIIIAVLLALAAVSALVFFGFNYTLQRGLGGTAYPV